MDPSGKVALVTGGAAGIGLACVQELLANDAKVAFCDIDAKAGKAALEEITKKYGEKAIFIEVDVTNNVSFEEAFKKTRKHFNGIDIVVNNAGMLHEREWERMIDVNLKGTIRGSLLGFQYLGKDHGGNGGVIVNVASINSILYFPAFPIYVATKHGVLAASKSLGMPFHYDRNGVRVVTLCPGTTYTHLQKTSVNNLYNPEWKEWLEEAISKSVGQTPEDCARSLLRMIRDAENGAAWVSEGGEDYLVTIPSPEAMRTKILYSRIA